MKRRWWIIIMSVALLGCSETVSVLTIELSLLPGYAKDFKCDADPRWSKYISVKANCDEGRVQSSYELQEGATLTLLNIPLGACTIEVETVNAHGRTVLTGEADVTLVEGKDETLKITLLPAPCGEPNCDADRDGLYNTDEKGLKTNPKMPDTDGDGLYDSVEVAFCCTDPLKKNKPGDCKLRIQSVKPALGVVGTMVKITATDALKSPTVSLGAVPLENLLTDATQVHGKVGKGAVLGDVVLSSSGVKSDPWELMFATLERKAESLVELQVRAGATSSLMHEVVDMTHFGKLLLMLGKATASWSTKNPMLLIVDREKNVYHRLVIPVAGLPVALAVGGTRLAVLLRDNKGQGMLVVLQYTLGKLKVIKTIPLKLINPVDVQMELKGDAAVVLFQGHLARVPLAATPSGTDKVLFKSIPAASFKGTTTAAKASCTGLALHYPPGANPGMSVAFASCNMPSALCPKNKKCPPRATLVRVSPVAKCLADNSSTTQPAGCWIHFQAGGVAVGAPEVSDKTKFVYVLTNKGIFGASLLNSSPNKATKLLLPVIPQGWPSKPGATDVMAADKKGHLFVVPPLQDRARMLRADPGNKDAARRKGRPFVGGQDGEEGLTMALHPDGSVLDVVRRAYDGTQGLTSVCLDRCSSCVCKK